MLVLTACGEAGDKTQTADDPATRARNIAHSSIIVDTHIDVPVRLQEKPDDISTATAGGDFDCPRAVDGGLNAPFMSIYTAASDGHGKRLADRGQYR